MIKSLTRRYRLLLPLFLLVLVGLTLPWQNHVYANNEATIPPAQVIADQALVVDQGIQIKWLDGQAGTHPISGFVIEKSRAGSDFRQIGRVEKDSNSYLDAKGRAKDVYRIIAEDQQTPAQRSEPSENLIAAVAKAGNTVAYGTPSDKIASKPLSVSAQLALLRRQIARTTQLFDKTIHNNKAVTGILSKLQGYQSQILSLLPRLLPSQKSILAKDCKAQAGILESGLRLAPETAQMDGMLVQAGCQAIQEAAR